MDCFLFPASLQSSKCVNGERSCLWSANVIKQSLLQYSELQVGNDSGQFTLTHNPAISLGLYLNFFFILVDHGLRMKFLGVVFPESKRKKTK